LETLLNSVYTGSSLGTVTVSAVAPDIVQTAVGTTADANLQVNLFLHQVTLNTAWRNIGYPSLSADGRTPLKNPPLALDLHYLLTVYASQNCLAEALLGYAVEFLFETPVLLRSQIDSTMKDLAKNHGIPNPLKTAGLDKSGLANQIEMIKITPATLGREEMAWLWTALKADYRPTFPFQASVVLIQDQKPLLSSLPVLQRQVTAPHPNALAPLAALTLIEPPNSQPFALLGDTVTAQGNNLSGASAVLLDNSRFGVEKPISALTNAGPSSFQFALNFAPAELPAGVYTLTAQVTHPPDTVDTNSLPLAIAPKITASPPSVTPDVHGNASVSITCTPYVWPDQEVFLLIGSHATPADAFTTATGTPSFTFSALTSTPKPVPLRLRVDGVDSPIIDYTQSPPVFTGPSIKVN